MRKKRAIESVPKSQEGMGFYSTFFLVPKKDGGLRPILNLRNLSVHSQVPHFKMTIFTKLWYYIVSKEKLKKKT